MIRGADLDSAIASYVIGRLTPCGYTITSVTRVAWDVGVKWVACKRSIARLQAAGIVEPDAMRWGIVAVKDLR